MASKFKLKWWLVQKSDWEKGLVYSKNIYTNEIMEDIMVPSVGAIFNFSQSFSLNMITFKINKDMIVKEINKTFKEYMYLCHTNYI